MSINLDILAAVLCGWVALCMGFLYAFTSAKHDKWPSFPFYLRGGFVVTGATCWWRAVNFIYLPPPPAPGHINAEGMMFLVALVYLVTAWAVHVGVFKRMLPHGWERLRWAESEARNGKVPVMVTRPQLVEMAKAEGFIVNGQMPDGEPLDPGRLH